MNNCSKLIRFTATAMALALLLSGCQRLQYQEPELTTETDDIESSLPDMTI